MEEERRNEEAPKRKMSESELLHIADIEYRSAQGCLFRSYYFFLARNAAMICAGYIHRSVRLST